MKQCGKCLLPKRPEDFHRRSLSPDGRSWMCKECYRNRHASMKDEILEILGGRCICCRTQYRVYLQVDHINGGGSKARRAGENWHTLVKQVRANPELFQVLCANCHTAKTWNNPCPDKVEDHNDIHFQ